MKPLMFVGTASSVGKSTIAAAFCRLLRQEGYQPAPFKAQNMSLNSYVTAEGLEMGRAQVVQAEAAGTPCHVDMNPVLLKPTSDQGSQVIVNGKVVGNQSAYAYFQSDNRDDLFKEAMEAYERLACRYHPIVIEGAGSISELNLKARDIVNMRVAQHTGADTYLIADIDRGGVFGSVYGTIELLSPEERRLIKGIIINKFRGDARLFADGRKILEDLTRLPVVGVLPFHDITLEEEDSVALEGKRKTGRTLPISTCWKTTRACTCIIPASRPSWKKPTFSSFPAVKIPWLT
jgi:adenosylcobyric acid synthase